MLNTGPWKQCLKETTHYFKLLGNKTSPILTKTRINKKFSNILVTDSNKIPCNHCLSKLIWRHLNIIAYCLYVHNKFIKLNWIYLNRQLLRKILEMFSNQNSLQSSNVGSCFSNFKQILFKTYFDMKESYWWIFHIYFYYLFFKNLAIIFMHQFCISKKFVLLMPKYKRKPYTILIWVHVESLYWGPPCFH